MAKLVIITLIDGTEYYVDHSKCITAVIDGFTGKKSTYPNDGTWTIKGVWFNKLLGKGFTSLEDFLNQYNMGTIHFTDKKGLCRYGVRELKNGVENNIGPLADRGITFLKIT